MYAISVLVRLRFTDNPLPYMCTLPILYASLFHGLRSHCLYYMLHGLT